MLAVSCDSRAAVDAMNEAAAKHGGTADINAQQDYGFMYNRSLADTDGRREAGLKRDRALTMAARFLRYREGGFFKGSGRRFLSFASAKPVAKRETIVRTTA